MCTYGSRPPKHAANLAGKQLCRISPDQSWAGRERGSFPEDIQQRRVPNAAGIGCIHLICIFGEWKMGTENAITVSVVWFSFFPGTKRHPCSVWFLSSRFFFCFLGEIWRIIYRFLIFVCTVQRNGEQTNRNLQKLSLSVTTSSQEWQILLFANKRRKSENSARSPSENRLCDSIVKLWNLRFFSSSSSPTEGEKKTCVKSQQQQQKLQKRKAKQKLIGQPALGCFISWCKSTTSRFSYDFSWCAMVERIPRFTFPYRW